MVCIKNFPFSRFVLLAAVWIWDENFIKGNSGFPRDKDEKLTLQYKCRMQTIELDKTLEGIELKTHIWKFPFGQARQGIRWPLSSDHVDVIGLAISLICLQYFGIPGKDQSVRPKSLKHPHKSYIWWEKYQTKNRIFNRWWGRPCWSAILSVYVKTN